MLVSLGIYFVGSVTLLLAIFAIIGSDDSLRGPGLLIGVAGPHALLVTHLLRVSRSKGHGLAADFQFRVCRSDIRMGIGLFFAALFGSYPLLIAALFGSYPLLLIVSPLLLIPVPLINHILYHICKEFLFFYNNM